jgi:hypothetical protein
MLHAMLRANDVMANFLQDYFRNSLAYLDYLHRHGSSGPLAQPVHWMKAWLENWSKPKSAGVDVGSEEPATQPSGDPMADRIRQLEERISLLEQEKNAKQ